MKKMPSGSRGELMMSGTMKMDQKDDINVRASPRRNRSKSPLRQNPPEVFARSPRSHRHPDDDEYRPSISQRSGEKIVSIDEDRPQQAPPMRVDAHEKK